MQMNEYGVCFDFPDDTGKTPLAEAEIEMLENDWYDAVQASNFVAFGNKIAYIVIFVLLTTFFAYIAFIALLSGSISGVLVYLSGALLSLYMIFRFKFTAKRVMQTFPDSEAKRTYKFYLHHFVFFSDYIASSISYDLVARAIENACGFTMIMTDGRTHYIPKRNLSAETISMLHSVMVNKFGSKFAVSIL